MVEFKCLKNCSDCCGCVPLDKQFYFDNIKMSCINPATIQLIMYDEKHIIPKTDDGKCMFLDREFNTCEIYLNRPVVCRLFGTTEKLPCPYLKPSGTLRTPAKIKQIGRQYKANLVKERILRR